MKLKLGILVVSAMVLLSACGETTKIEQVDSSTTNKAEAANNTAKEDKTKLETEEKAKEEVDKKEESVPREHKAALEKAKTYAEVMHMSKAGIYDQLTSEYGENFPKEAAQYAIDNIEFDWKDAALKKAQLYAESMSMSNADIYDQLISEHGEKFTKEEAQYAVDNLE